MISSRSLALLVTASLLLWSSAAFAAPAAAPNVVVITIDTLRADHLGCYGYKQIVAMQSASRHGKASEIANRRCGRINAIVQNPNGSPGEAQFAHTKQKRSAGILPAVARASRPRHGGRDARRTAAGTAALPKPSC